MTNIEIICTVTGAVVAVLGGVWAMFTFVFKIGQTKEHLDMFEKNTGERFEGVDRRLDKIEDTLDIHTKVLVRICSFLDLKFPKNSFLFSMKMSPRRLNPTGEKLFDAMGGARFLRDNKEQLFANIDREKPQTRLDVETAAMLALMTYLPSPAFNGIKDTVYNMPSIDTEKGKYDVTMTDVCFVLSLPLRDMYIKERGIK